MEYLNAFLCGGILCAIGQILIDRTQLTPARILTGYVVTGVLLGAVGVYQPIADWGGAGASVPLTGFGFALAKGVKKAVAEQGWLGAVQSDEFKSFCDEAGIKAARARSGSTIWPVSTATRPRASAAASTAACRSARACEARE